MLVMLQEWDLTFSVRLLNPLALPVIGSSIGLSGGWDAMVFPVIVSSVGVFVCLLCSFIATNIWTVKKEADVDMALKVQLISTTIVMVPAVYFAASFYCLLRIALDYWKHHSTLDSAKSNNMCLHGCRWRIDYWSRY